MISLPQETFVSSGASVKCSLLFLQKFTLEEKQNFNDIFRTVKAEIDEKYSDEIVAEIKRLESEIAKAREEKNIENHKSLKKELKT